MTEMEVDDEGEAILREKSLIDVVFSWSLEDVLNKDLYKDKVTNIPSTFQSNIMYMKSFVFPLIEETHADLSSSIDKVASASTCKILSIEAAENHDPSDKCLYIIEVEKKDIRSDHGAYEPETGDLFAITDIRPTCVDDLNRPTISYLLALVQRVTDERDFIKIQVYSSRPFLDEHGILKRHTKDSFFLVSLINTTTYARIWNSLRLGLKERNLDVIQNVLQPRISGKEKCNLCLQEGVYRLCRLKILVSNSSFNLNDSQQEAVLNCLATKYCHHVNMTKLIWGPPGTGKTKTVSALLFLLLSLNCRTVTCAPTNIAVLEVARRVLRLVLESSEFLTYGLGDIILFGNIKRMNINNQDELLHIFLDHRTKALARCFAPASGWNYSLHYLISLLEDAELLYQLYSVNGQEEDADAGLYQKYDNNNNNDDNDSENAALQKESLKNKGAKSQRLCAQGFNDEWNKRILQHVITKTIKLNDESKHDRGSCKNKKHSRSVQRKGCNDIHQTKERLNFEDFVKSRLNSQLEAFTFYVVNFLMHLPTSLLSLGVAKDMIKAVNLLYSLSSLLQNVTFDGRMLKEVFVGNEEVGRRLIDGFSNVESAKQECLKILKSLPDSFFKSEDEYSIKNEILKNACLLFCTASSSYKLHEMDSELLVIDEAAQLKECESTIPLQIPGLRHAILIGDECQLPAMVKSKVCEEANFGRSLFERLVLLQFKKNLLNLQYRMHPSISSFPNREFYQNQITDAPNVRHVAYQKHYLQGEIYGTYSFINVACGNEEAIDGHSIRNMVEVAVVCEVIGKLFEGVFASGEKISVGIISPYNAQIAAIKENLGTKYSTDDESDFSVDVRSVDGFQGGEKDIIIISAVRSNSNRSIGFLSNSRRINVALTRARRCLWIFGNEPTLKSGGSAWKKLVHDARVRGCFHDAQNDKDLAKAMAAALIDIDPLDIKIHLYSVLLQGTRWKVNVDDYFWKAMQKIKSTEVRKKAISILMKLSSDWLQWPCTERITILNGTSTQFLELFPVDGLLHIVLTLDTVKETSSYVNVMWVWDIRPLTEIPNLDPMLLLCKQLDAFHLKDES